MESLKKHFPYFLSFSFLVCQQIIDEWTMQVRSRTGIAHLKETVICIAILADQALESAVVFVLYS